MKKYYFGICRIIVIVMFLTAIFTAVPVFANTAIYEQYIGADSSVQTSQPGWQYQTFTAIGSHEVMGVALKVWTATNQTGNFTVTLCSVDGSHFPDVALATKTVLASTLPSSETVETGFVFVQPYTVTDGTEYAIKWRRDSAGAIVGKIKSSGDPYANGTSGYYDVAWNEWATADFYFKVYGTLEQSFKVVTLNVEYDKYEKPYFRGMIASLGELKTTKASFEWGTDTSYGNNTSDKTVSGEASRGLFSEYMDGLPIGVIIHYRARAIKDYVGGSPVYSYGEDKIVEIGGRPAVELRNATNIKYFTADVTVLLYSLGVETSVSLELNYGETSAMATNYVIDATATAPDEYKLNLTGLDEDTVYIMRAVADTGDPDTDGYSEIIRFRTLNSLKDPAVNKVDSWLTTIGFGTGAWWLIILVLMVGVWLVGPIREHPFIGVILDLVVLGAAIALSVIDIWIVILLAFAAGITIVGLVLRKQQG